MPEDVLVTADWVESNLDAFQDDDSDHRLVEINNPTVTDESEYTPYEEGHVPGALNFEWDAVFTDETERDIVSKEDFAKRNGEGGIDADTTVVVYGGGRVPNWFALFGYWIYKYYGHDDVRVIDGGKGYWVENDYPLSTEEPDFTPREYEARGPFESVRAYKDDIDKAIEEGIPMVDVRSPEEFSGEVIAPEGLNETAQRGGHIPGASNVPIGTTLNEDGTFKSAEELRELYSDAGVDGDESTITYCRVGERSSIEWFLLHELLGYDDVRNYDGSWTEWGNLVGAPIETGD
ncbi:MAG: sulfurtransferase [Methanobacteriota archaeon]